MVTELTVNSIAINIHEDLEEFELTKDGRQVVAWDSDGRSGYLDELPEGSWQILGRGNELTEEQADQIVVRFNNPCSSIAHGKYHVYDRGPWSNTVGDPLVDTALESFASLLRSKNVPIDNVIILVKQ